MMPIIFWLIWISFIKLIHSWKIPHRSIYSSYKYHSLQHIKSISNDNNNEENIDIINNYKLYREQAIDLIDCLTLTKDTKSIQYDYQKDIRRQKLLLSNDYLVSY
jgi:hypothetical protein